MRYVHWFMVLLALCLNVSAWSQEAKKQETPKAEAKKEGKKEEKKIPVPAVPITEANVPYGTHERQVLDFWKANSDQPTPVAFCIHGGGWRGGDKNSYYGGVKAFLDQGISVVAINYRLIKLDGQSDTNPPVKAPLEDAARALQFVRSKATEWNLDKKRIGATGDSAGGCSSLWLAFHDDLADPNSSDPIARESTRLYCAGVNGAQVSLDLEEVRAWLPNYTYGTHAFALKGRDDFLASREKIAPWLKEYSPILHVSSDDPPIGLFYGGVKGAKVGEEHPDPTHSPILGVKLGETLKAKGVEFVYHSNTEPNAELPNSTAFLIMYLKK